MTIPSEPSTTLDRLPPGYQQVLYWRITEKASRLIWMQVLSIPLFVFFLAVFYALAFTVGRMPTFGEIRLGLGTIVMVVGILLVFVLHELVHGTFMRLFGAHPIYGVMWKQGMFYATSPGYPFRRNNYLVVALAPLVLISLLAVLGMVLLAGTGWVGTLAIIATVNASGAIGDMWMSILVLRYPAYAYFVDEKDGVRVFLPAEEPNR